MGTVKPGTKITTFVGLAESSSGDHEGAPTLNQAFESAAGEAMRAGIIGGDATAWFDVTFIEVELGNQHPRAYKVGVTQKGGGGR